MMKFLLHHLASPVHTAYEAMLEPTPPSNVTYRLCQALAIAVLVLTIAHALGYFAPRALPHRAVTDMTNWGQGRAPASNICPIGTIRFETDDGLFLECFRP
jgi:hypothetical protein